MIIINIEYYFALVQIHSKVGTSNIATHSDSEKNSSLLTNYIWNMKENGINNSKIQCRKNSFP
uniref:Uncharacterized protein n=1 Tax=Octopus bimaculoides TaxID=37653 RepID=A0A0L8I961_OCTBM